ncbi:MAG: ABC transporter permease [Anaerolineae bacterium]|nr:ABC transporter permease [Anaerolineae bacterium]
MHRVIIRRVVVSIPVLLLTTLLSFTLMRLAPGDPVDMYLSSEQQSAPPETVARIREELGLNDPISVQYMRWLGRALQGDLGFSYQDRLPVLGRVLQTLPASISLMGASLLLAMLVGIGIGVFSAWRQHSLFDHVMTVLAFVGYAIPSFFLALLLLYGFSYELNLLPSNGMRSLRPGGYSPFVDLLRHYILPVSALAIHNVVIWIRYQRNNLVEELGKDYLTTARAKGLPESVVRRHAWRNSLIPISTLLGLSIAELVGGSFIIESIFGWPGMGRLGIDSINSRDYPVSMGILLVSSVMILVGNLVADLLYAWLDPRVSYESRASR